MCFEQLQFTLHVDVSLFEARQRTQDKPVLVEVLLLLDTISESPNPELPAPSPRKSSRLQQRQLRLSKSIYSRKEAKKARAHTKNLVGLLVSLRTNTNTRNGVLGNSLLQCLKAGQRAARVIRSGRKEDANFSIASVNS